MPGAAEDLANKPFYLRVNVSSGLDTLLFKLHVYSQGDLRWLVPGVRLHPYVLIAHDEDRQKDPLRELKELDPSLLPHVAELLTGLTIERLRELDVRLVFMETRSQATLAEFPA